MTDQIEQTETSAPTAPAGNAALGSPAAETGRDSGDESALEWVPLLTTLYLWGAVLTTGMRWLAHHTPWDGGGAVFSLVLSFFAYHLAWSRRFIDALGVRLALCGVILGIWAGGIAMVMRGLGFPG